MWWNLFTAGVVRVFTRMPYVSYIFLPVTIPVGLIGYGLHIHYRSVYGIDGSDVEQISTVDARLHRVVDGGDSAALDLPVIGKTIFDKT